MCIRDRSYTEIDFHNSNHQLSDIDSTLNCFTHKQESMEQCSPISHQLHIKSNSLSVKTPGLTTTSKTEEVLTVGEPSGHYTKSHPVPHHSLTVSLSDPDSPLSHQVCMHGFSFLCMN